MQTFLNVPKRSELTAVIEDEHFQESNRMYRCVDRDRDREGQGQRGAEVEKRAHTSTHTFFFGAASTAECMETCLALKHGWASVSGGTCSRLATSRTCTRLIGTGTHCCTRFAASHSTFHRLFPPPPQHGPHNLQIALSLFSIAHTRVCVIRDTVWMCCSCCLRTSLWQIWCPKTQVCVRVL